MSDAVEKHIEESCKNFLDGQIPCNLPGFLQQTQIKYGVPQYRILRIIRNYVQRNNILFDFSSYLSRSTAQKAYVHVKFSASGAEIFSNSDGIIPSYINCQEKSENVARSWDVFRKLIAYYTSCIEMEDGATAFAFQDQINEVFCYLQKNGKWFPQPGHPWQCCVPLAGDSQIRNLWKSDAGQLVLGYPVYATCKKDGDHFVTTVTPIYYYQLTHKFSARGLELCLTEAMPQVNLHWLDVAFGRNPSARRQFLEACGLSTAQTDEVQEVQPACGVSFSGLASMLTAVALRTVCEPLSPESVSAEPLKPPFANGIYNRAVVMISRKTRYSRTLLAELAGIAALPDSVLERTALKYIFCPEPQKEACAEKRDAAVPESAVQMPDSEGLLTASGLMNPDAVAEILPFNVRQREAVAALLSAPLTVLQGPPGTGKSQVVAGASACARLSGQFVLISSRNHKAIDAVMGRIEETPGGRPPVLRANSKDDPNLRYSFLKALKDLLSEQVDTEARAKSPDVLKNLRGRLRERAQLGLTARRITTLAEQLGEISEHLAHCETQMGADLLGKLQKIPYKFSRTCAASVDFIARCEREKRSFARAVVSPECFSGLRTLLRLRKFLQKTNSAPGLHFWRRNDAESLSVLKNRLQLAAEWAELKTAEKACEHTAAKLPPLAAVTADFEQCGKRIAAILPEALKLDALRRPGVPPGTDRSDLDMLRAGLLAARTAFAGHVLRREAEEKLAEQLPALLDACPVWAVTSLSAGTFIPLLPGMFDTVIIDEASQSDIPSAIPLLFRAKRAAVVGDPCQLPFISTMGAEKDTLLRRNAGLAGLADLRFAYAANSLYDVAAGSPAAVCRMLCETYRSSAEIAAYSNELFYHNALSVCTAEERLHVPSGKKAGIEWTDVVGEIVGAPGGSAFCQAEVDAVVTLVHELLVLGYRKIPKPESDKFDRCFPSVAYPFFYP